MLHNPSEVAYSLEEVRSYLILRDCCSVAVCILVPDSFYSSSNEDRSIAKLKEGAPNPPAAKTAVINSRILNSWRLSKGKKLATFSEHNVISDISI
jgi:hypothetical protein